MVAPIKITQGQAPQFLAIIKTVDGRLFDVDEDLATQAELDAEGLEEAFPASYTVYKSTSGITPFAADSKTAEVVPGYQNREIETTAFLLPEEVEAQELDYNFKFTPENRATAAFTEIGFYFVDFRFYPKVGAAIVIRVQVQVA